jgi:hypothetical protein
MAKSLVYFFLSEFLLFNIKWASLQLYHDKNKLHYSYIMTRTSYITAISWQEQVTLQLDHDKNKLYYSYIMTRTRYITAISWPEQVTLQLHHDKNNIHYNYIMTRTSYITACMFYIFFKLFLDTSSYYNRWLKIIFCNFIFFINFSSIITQLIFNMFWYFLYLDVMMHYMFFQQ